MNATADSELARRYLLGHATEQESVAIEQEFLRHEEAVARLEAVEDELIEDYVGHHLTAADRDRFERTYLSAPHHRVRVETVRRLIEQAARSAPAGSPRKGSPNVGPLRRYGPWLALAASLLVVASTALWVFSPYSRQRADVAVHRTPDPSVASTPAPERSAPAASATPRVFAVTISPVSVRSASDSPSVRVPADAEIVAIRLEGDADTRRLTPRRAAIRTVDGRQAWEGPVATGAALPAGAVAEIDVPAASVPADDYLVTLYGTDRAGSEQEWSQYFLRLRAE